MWFLGDAALKDWFTTFASMHKQAVEKNQPQPYLFAYYNLDHLYSNQMSDNRSLLARIINALIDKLNEHSHLPRYIVILIDKDLILNAQVFDFGVCDTFEHTTRWLLNNIVCVIEQRKIDLHNKRPGSVVAGSEPRFIWVKAVVRPEIMLGKSTYSLVGKFNMTLEDIVASNRHSHILKIDVQKDNTHFDRSRNLTPLGIINFWRDLDAQIKDFDRGKTAVAN